MENYVEEAIALVEKEQAVASAFAMELFDHLQEAGITPSVEVDGKFYISVEAVSAIAQAASSSAITLSFSDRGGPAAESMGKISQILDALSRQAQGIPPRSVRDAAKDLGL